jgi:glycosyltransferase involved in cell wall biosynthesis
MGGSSQLYRVSVHRAMTYNRTAMRLLFVADGRSPIAQNWIRFFAERGDEIYLASTFACSLDFPLNGLEVIPVAFSGLKKASQRPGTGPARTVGLRTAIRQWLGPLTIRRAADRLRSFIDRVKPNLVHAMRIPYEGMLAADAYTGTPLLVSTWGNDFTLHAPSTRLMSHYTRWTMQVADALHADCQRDVRLAKEWGFGQGKPALVAPGNGGIRTDVFYPPSDPVQEPVILNPRGVRPYVRNDVFFRAIPLVLARQPQAKFIFTLMAGEPQALEWISALRIDHAVELLPPMSHFKMAETFRRAQIVASPSIHDGTPNSLLEGIACGCFPVAGDLESIREWITPGENGLLFDPANPQSIADALLTSMENKNLRERAAGLNQNIIATRAEYQHNMKRAAEFYDRLLARSVTRS